MAAHNSWATLPSIIIVEILSYLALTDRLNASAICRRWRNCLLHPSLWRSMTFRLNSQSRRKAKHLTESCGKFVREAVVEFNSKHVGNVRECLRVLKILGENVNMERFALRPQSCQVAWPVRDSLRTMDTKDLSVVFLLFSTAQFCLLFVFTVSAQCTALFV